MSGIRTATPQLGDQLDDDRSSEPSRKRRAIEVDLDDEGNVPEEKANNAPTGGGILNAKREYNVTKRTFRHHRILTTCGYQFNTFIGAKGEDVPDQYTIRQMTPYAMVPVHCTPFYLSPAEYDICPIGSIIKKCKVTIKSLGYRVPFTTNSSVVSTANAATLVLGMYGHGLCNKYGGQNLAYKSELNAPMIPTTTFWDEGEGCHTAKLWGSKHIPGTNPPYENYPSAFGKEYQLDNYYIQESIQNKEGENWPPLMDEINLFKMTPFNADSGPITWEYRPQSNILKPVQTRQGRYCQGEYTSEFVYGYKARAPIVMSYHNDNGTYNTSYLYTTDINEKDRYEQYNSDFYNTYIEQCGVSSHGMQEYGGGFRPPSLHIGVMPTNTYSVTEKQSEVATIVSLWSCSTEVEIESSLQETDTLFNLQPYNSQMYSNLNLIRIGSMKLNIRGMLGRFLKKPTTVEGKAETSGIATTVSPITGTTVGKSA